MLKSKTMLLVPSPVFIKSDVVGSSDNQSVTKKSGDSSATASIRPDLL